MLDKFAIATDLREISRLLELKKENPYKARAYAVGASAIEGVNEELSKLMADRRLTTIKGIGESLAVQIEELYVTGASTLLEKLRKEMPAGVVELSQIPGLSVKKIQVLHDELGISSIAELQAACDAGQVAHLPGFGRKTELNILEGIQKYETREQAELLADALASAAELMAHLKGAKAIKRVEKAGALRRWQETVSCLDLVAATTDSAAAIRRFSKFPRVTTCEIVNENRAEARLADGVRVNFQCASEEDFPVAWLMDTGAPTHIERLNEIAESKGFTLSRDGLRKGKRLLNIEREEEVYQNLGLPYIPPELRENAGEFEQVERGETFDDLLRIEQIQGLTHCHTEYSDGKNTIEQMALAADLMDMKYMTITDHSPTAHYAGGVEIDRLKRQWDEIEQVQEKVKVRLLRGTESDILADGALDYPDHILDQFDIIIASVHSRMKMDEDQMTRRLVNCMRKQQFKIWGHALGRLLLRRDPFACRVEEILDAVAESRAAIEVNGDPHRLDMEPKWIREGRKRGIQFVISVDAHSTAALRYLEFGVRMARRGGLRKSEVLNTLPVDRFIDAVKPAIG